MTKYLKKPDAPDWDYHIWTPFLAARGDMEPFTPNEPILTPALEEKVPSEGEFGSLVETPVIAEASVKQGVKAAKKGAKNGSARASRFSTPKA